MKPVFLGTGLALRRRSPPGGVEGEFSPPTATPSNASTVTFLPFALSLSSGKSVTLFHATFGLTIW